MWIARDRDGKLFIYNNNLLTKFQGRWSIQGGTYIHLWDSLFPKVHWEDKNPKWIRLLRFEWIDIHYYTCDGLSYYLKHFYVDS